MDANTSEMSCDLFKKPASYTDLNWYVRPKFQSETQNGNFTPIGSEIQNANFTPIGSGYHLGESNFNSTEDNYGKLFDNMSVAEEKNNFRDRPTSKLDNISNLSFLKALANDSSKNKVYRQTYINSQMKKTSLRCNDQRSQNEIPSRDQSALSNFSKFASSAPVNVSTKPVRLLDIPRHEIFHAKYADHDSILSTNENNTNRPYMPYSKSSSMGAANSSANAWRNRNIINHEVYAHHSRKKICPLLEPPSSMRMSRFDGENYNRKEAYRSRSLYRDPTQYEDGSSLIEGTVLFPCLNFQV